MQSDHVEEREEARADEIDSALDHLEDDEEEEELLSGDAPPIPYLTLFTLSCVIICDSLSITFIFPV
jgi:hypothetical protein